MIHHKKKKINPVALRKESVDRNMSEDVSYNIIVKSLSARRAWIEITRPSITGYLFNVALRKESVDRNCHFCDDVSD